MVAVVERGGFLWFYEFFLLILWIFFSVSSFFWPGILVPGGHSHWLTGGGTSGILLVLSHMAKADGYMSWGFC